MSWCLGGLKRPVINEGCSSFFPLVSFLVSFFLFFHSIQLHAQSKTAFHYDPYTHFDALRRLRQRLIRSLRRVINKKIMFASTDYTFQKDHYSVFVPRKTAACWSISLSPPHPSGFLFPEEYKLINSTVTAASCHLTLLPLQNTGFRFSFPRTLLADRRSFFLSLTWARISSSLLVSLLLYKENKNCDECNRVAYFDAWCMARKRKRDCMQLENNNLIISC